MRRVRSRDTKPEMRVRSLIHRLGYRYRLHVRGLPGSPDIVFKSRGKVIFVHGCFWHGHKGCANHRIPKSNVEYWVDKVESNRRRDARVRARLRRLGFGIMVIWECQTRDEGRLRNRITGFLEG